MSELLTSHSLHVMNVFSVKFVGLFVTGLIGISTIAELWQLLGDLSMPMVSYSLKLYK